MAKHCNLCTNEYNLEDYEPSYKIFKIMEEKGLCFSCAFWTWRLAEDKALQLLHDNKDIFLAKLRKEEVDDMAPLESFEQSDETLLNRYPKWWFGRPVILDGSHHIYHLGKINKPSRVDSHHNYILMDDGTIYPYLMGLYGKEGLTFQGEIPAHFMWSHNTQDGFKNNAVLLSEIDIEELKAQGIKRPFIYQPNKVPEKILKKYFKNLY
jgi:hypothetical protein|nr:MAG TPA: hypothetical protein [Caudoviricetes sp.]